MLSYSLASDIRKFPAMPLILICQGTDSYVCCTRSIVTEILPGPKAFSSG